MMRLSCIIINVLFSHFLYINIFLYFYFRFGDVGVASYCVNVTDSLCVNIVPFLTLLIIFYAFRVTSLIDFGELKGGVVGGGGTGLGGIGGGLFGGLDGIFGGVTGIMKISSILLHIIIINKCIYVHIEATNYIFTLFSGGGGGYNAPAQGGYNAPSPSYNNPQSKYLL